MPECDSELAQVYLRPGEYHLAREPTVIRTILGSCVGVTFWCERLRVGALCHSMLPICPTEGSADIEQEVGYRYVDFCIRDLARQFDLLGARRSEVEVKLFGGADVLSIAGTTNRPTVGSMNCETATRVLEAEGFLVVAFSIRETFGRKIRFNTTNGEVLLRKLI